MTKWCYNNFDVDVDNAIIYLNKTKYTKNSSFKNCLVENYNQLLKSEMDNRHIASLNFIPTFKCFGNCEYCYNKCINNTINDELTVEKMKNAIQHLEDNNFEVAPKVSRVYGGEPFLSDNIFGIIDYMYNRYDTFTYISSGMLFSEEYFDSVLKKIIEFKNLRKLAIGVSCDIACETRCNDLDITWKDIHKKAEILSQYNLGHLVVNTVLTKYSNLNKIFSIILENIKNYDIYYRLAIAVGDNTISVTEEQLKELYHFFIDNISNNHILTENFTKDFMENFSFNKLENGVYALFSYPKYCGLFSSMITVTPSGEFIHCHMRPLDRAININDFVDKDLFLKGSNNCFKCKLYLLCRGNCFYRVNKYENNKIYCKWLEYKYKIMFAKLDYFFKDFNL